MLSVAFCRIRLTKFYDGNFNKIEDVCILCYCPYWRLLRFYTNILLLLVRLPPGRWGVLSPNHVTPVFFYNVDLKDSEKLRVTFQIHSFLLENLKKVLKNHNFLEKLENLYSLMVLAKYY